MADSEEKKKRIPRRRAAAAHDAIVDFYGDVLDAVREQGGSANELDRVVNALYTLLSRGAR